MSSLNKKKPGDDLLSHLEGSTIGVEELNFRVRNGNGCGLFTIVTRHNYLKKGKKDRQEALLHTGKQDGIHTNSFDRSPSIARHAFETRSIRDKLIRCKKVKDNMVKPHSRLVVVD